MVFRLNMGQSESHPTPRRNSLSAGPSVRTTSSLANNTAQSAATTANRNAHSTPNLISHGSTATENVAATHQHNTNAGRSGLANPSVTASTTSEANTVPAKNPARNSTQTVPDSTVRPEYYRKPSTTAASVSSDSSKVRPSAEAAGAKADKVTMEEYRQYILQRYAQRSAKNQEKGVQADFPKVTPASRDGSAQATNIARTARPEQLSGKPQNVDKPASDPKKQPECSSVFKLKEEHDLNRAKKENVASRSQELHKNSASKVQEVTADVENKQRSSTEASEQSGKNKPKNIQVEPPKTQPKLIDVEEKKFVNENLASGSTKGEASLATSTTSEDQNKGNTQKENKQAKNCPKKPENPNLNRAKEQKGENQSKILSYPAEKKVSSKKNCSVTPPLMAPTYQQNPFKLDRNQAWSPPSYPNSVWMTGFEPNCQPPPWWNCYGPSYPYGWNYNKMKYSSGQNPYEWTASQRDGSSANSCSPQKDGAGQGRSRALDLSQNHHRSQSLFQNKKDHVRFVSPCSERGSGETEDHQFPEGATARKPYKGVSTSNEELLGKITQVYLKFSEKRKNWGDFRESCVAHP